MRKSFSSSRFLQSSAAAHLALCRARNLRLPRRFPGLRGSRDQKIHCRFQACSLRTIEVARKQGLLEPPSESSRIFGIIWRFGRSFQIEAIEHRGDLGELLDQRSNQAQEFLLLWPVARCNEEGSDLNVGDLAARRKIRLMPDEYPPSIGVV